MKIGSRTLELRLIWILINVKKKGIYKYDLRL